ncbi:peptidoglycan-recognition protein SC2-like [Phymastichus coffea]|uniref:peptidoglycan-recognition protein SC2-like n=1 Tax=Phymastichus coffea TaxID=108790 RepID=UPI00273CA5AE|nr:peptidoglycan-recognition protein SC2-like [Phymastichus coffea]
MASTLKNLLLIGLLIIGSLLIPTNGTRLNVSFPLVTRSEWSSRTPAKPASPLHVLPSPYVIVSHTATGQCNTLARCKSIVHSIQDYHMGQNGWDDIGYNFLVGGDGNIYEGRGWDVQGAHTKNYNSKSIGLSFIGNFNKEQPTDAQLEAAKSFLDYGLQNKKISDNYKLLGQRQLISTVSPGDLLYNIIKTWSHWSQTP